MRGVGLEPTQISLGDLKSPALTISAILATYILCSLSRLIINYILLYSNLYNYLLIINIYRLYYKYDNFYLL